MSAVTFELPYNFVHTAHTISQYGTSDEQQRRLDATVTGWYESHPSAQTAPIGVVEATVSRLMHEIQVLFARNNLAADEGEIMPLDAVFVGQPIDVVPIRMRVEDTGTGRSVAAFDINDLCPDDIDELF